MTRVLRRSVLYARLASSPTALSFGQEFAAWPSVLTVVNVILAAQFLTLTPLDAAIHVGSAMRPVISALGQDMPMTKEQIRKFEEKSRHSFPQWYVDVLQTPWFDKACEEIYDDEVSLEIGNKNIEINGSWGFRWEKWYWAIGGDGAGGIYFISLKNDLNFNHVFYVDHECPPIDIQDVDNISKYSIPEFKKYLHATQLEFIEHCENIVQAVEKRRWYQFWVPRRVPLWANEEVKRKSFLKAMKMD